MLPLIRSDGWVWLALLLVGVLTHARWARGATMAASLALAFVFQAGLLSDPAGTVLDGTYNADRTSALWGLLFLAGTAVANAAPAPGGVGAAEAALIAGLAAFGLIILMSRAGYEAEEISDLSDRDGYA